MNHHASIIFLRAKEVVRLEKELEEAKEAFLKAVDELTKNESPWYEESKEVELGGVEYE